MKNEKPSICDELNETEEKQVDIYCDDELEYENVTFSDLSLNVSIFKEATCFDNYSQIQSLLNNFLPFISDVIQSALCLVPELYAMDEFDVEVTPHIYIVRHLEGE